MTLSSGDLSVGNRCAWFRVVKRLELHTDGRHSNDIVGARCNSNSCSIEAGNDLPAHDILQNSYSVRAGDKADRHFEPIICQAPEYFRHEFRWR